MALIHSPIDRPGRVEFHQTARSKRESSLDERDPVDYLG